MALALFGETDLPLQPKYHTQFSLFSSSSISQLYELIDPVPVYTMTWNVDGTDLFIPTSSNGLHHINFTSSIKSLTSQPTQPPSVFQLNGSNNDQPALLSSPAHTTVTNTTTTPPPLTTTIIRVTDAPITKILPAPNNPHRFLLLIPTEGIKIFDIITTSKRGIEYKLFVTIQHPSTSPSSQQQSQQTSGKGPTTTTTTTSTTIPNQMRTQTKDGSHPSSFSTYQPTNPSILPTIATKPFFIDAFFKTSTTLTLLDNLNQTFTYNLLSQSPQHPLKQVMIFTSTMPSLLRGINQTTTSINQNGFQNTNKFGLIQPLPVPDLLTQLYPHVIAKIHQTTSLGSGSSESLVQHSVDNNASVHESNKFNSLSGIIVNNVLDDNVIASTSHGDLMWCDSKSMLPFLTKKISTSPINCITLSTTTSNNLTPISIRTLSHDYSTALSQISNYTRSHQQQQQQQQQHAPRDEKFYQLNNTRMLCGEISSQLQSEQYIAVGSNDGLITILSAADLSTQYTVHCHDNPIISLSFSPCGAYLASLSLNQRSLTDLEDGNITMVKGLFCIIHLSSGNIVYQRQNHAITSFAWNPSYPIGAFVSLVCSSGTNSTFDDNSNRRGYNSGFRRNNNDTSSGTNKGGYYSQITIIDFSTTLLPQSTCFKKSATSSSSTASLFNSQWTSSLEAYPTNNNNNNNNNNSTINNSTIPLPSSHFHTTLSAPSSLFYSLLTPQSLSTASLQDPMNKVITVRCVDTLTASTQNSTHGKHGNTWATQAQHKFTECSAWKNLSTQARATAQQIILNANSVTNANLTSTAKPDRFAHIKDNLSDFVAGADEVESASSSTTTPSSSLLSSSSSTIHSHKAEISTEVTSPINETLLGDTDHQTRRGGGSGSGDGNVGDNTNTRGRNTRDRDRDRDRRREFTLPSTHNADNPNARQRERH